MPSNLTVNKKGEKMVLLKSVGYEKSRLTLMLDVTADGQKLRPYFILKRKTFIVNNLRLLMLLVIFFITNNIDLLNIVIA